MGMDVVYRSLVEYIATHPQQLGNHESILGVLYDCYNENRAIETAQMKAGFDQIHALLGERLCDESESVIDTVCMLCGEYEKIGFTAGVQIGIRLAQEMNSR